MVFPIMILMIGLAGAATMAAGYSYHKNNMRRNPHHYGRGPFHHKRRHFFPDDQQYDDYFGEEYGDEEYGDEYEDEFYDPRPPPRSRRNPNDVSLFDRDIEENGNYAMRGRMMKYAKHKLNSRYGFQASIWDLEPFLK